jgi:hypothetical protein
MNWISVNDDMPYDDEEVIFTDGKDWWKGHVGGYYDYGQDRRIYPVWWESGQVVSDVTHWARVVLP